MLYRSFRKLLDDRFHRFVSIVIYAPLLQPFAKLLIFFGNIHELFMRFKIFFKATIQTLVRVEKGVKFFFVFFKIFIQFPARKQGRDLKKPVEFFSRERADFLAVKI